MCKELRFGNLDLDKEQDVQIVFGDVMKDQGLGQIDNVVYEMILKNKID